jgi:hypothetical protein
MKRRYRRLIRLVESPIVMHHLSSHSLEKMRTIYFLLSLCVYTICEVSLQSAAGIVPTVQLLPEGFSALRDYEVLSVHQEADEDVVRIRSRTVDPIASITLVGLTAGSWNVMRKVKTRTPKSAWRRDIACNVEGGSHLCCTYTLQIGSVS